MVRQLSSCNTLGLREIQIVYEVRFNPEVDSKLALSKYINQHRWVIGNAETFAGVKLFLPIRYLEGIFFKRKLQCFQDNMDDYFGRDSL